MKQIICFSLFLICSQSVFVSCQRPKVQQPETIRTPETPIELTNYTLHRVNLSWENIVMDSTGVTSTYKTAFLVKFSLKNMPTSYGPAVRFFIGDAPVREYGQWSEGIYFKIYQEKELQSLQGKEISYSFNDEKRTSLQKRFEFGKSADLALESEAEVLKSR